MSTIQYRSLKQYKYQLMRWYGHILPDVFPEDFHCLVPYISILRRELWISKGYAWNGPKCSGADFHIQIRGSLVYDALCQLINLGILGQEYQLMVDEIFKNVCLEDGKGTSNENVSFGE